MLCKKTNMGSVTVEIVVVRMSLCAEAIQGISLDGTLLKPCFGPLEGTSGETN